MEIKQKTLQQYFIQRKIPTSDEKREKHQKLSTVGSSFDFNVSSQGVKRQLLEMYGDKYKRDALTWLRRQVGAPL